MIRKYLSGSILDSTPGVFSPSSFDVKRFLIVIFVESKMEYLRFWFPPPVLDEISEWMETRHPGSFPLISWMLDPLMITWGIPRRWFLSGMTWQSFSRIFRPFLRTSRDPMIESWDIMRRKLSSLSRHMSRWSPRVSPMRRRSDIRDPRWVLRIRFSISESWRQRMSLPFGRLEFLWSPDRLWDCRWCLFDCERMTCDECVNEWCECEKCQ